MTTPNSTSSQHYVDNASHPQVDGITESFRSTVDHMSSNLADTIMQSFAEMGIAVNLDEIGLAHRLYAAIMDSVLNVADPAMSTQVSQQPQQTDIRTDAHLEFINLDESYDTDITGYNEDKMGNEEKNYCLICGVDMGANNPRQLCRKTYCDSEYGL